MHAHGADSAAEKFAESYDGDGEYTILQRGSAVIEVRKPDSSEVQVFDIAAESVPQYTAFVSEEEPVTKPTPEATSDV